MVKHARELYPGLQFKVGDALDTMQFQSNAFTLITCLYFTLYYIDNKPLFFKNCYKWLMPGGFLAVHIVDPKNFDPIMPAGDPFLYVSPQNYAKERITTSVVKFNNFDYKSKFDLKSASDEDGPNAVLTETFKDHGSGNVRVNEHELYMPEPQEIIDMAKDAGFIVSAQIDMLKCQYAYQYIYIFQKPT
jgi:ubiquinone/menaquinone biosynthesis C-methylase UbiE